MSEEAQPFDYETPTAKYNFGFSWMYRINESLAKCNVYQAQDMMEDWYKEIIILYKELYPKMTKDEKQKMDSKRVLAEKKDDGKMAIYRKKLMAHINTSKGNNMPFFVDPELINFLLDWEMEIRYVCDRYGLLMPDKDDARFAMMQE